MIYHTNCISREIAAGDAMVRNNIEIDVKTKCIEEGITQATLAERVETSAQYVSKVMKKPDGVVNKTFVTMMEKLGYDIQLTYIKRN